MSSARPLVGVSACRRVIGSDSVHAVAHRYLAPVLSYAEADTVLTPAAPGQADPRNLARRLDGLLLTGSPSNVAPQRYGMSADQGEGPFDPDRDLMTAQLVDAMLEAGRPVFGICRGLQELNVFFGGSLRTDACTAPELIAHHAPADASFSDMFAHEHDVRLEPGGVLQRTYGEPRLRVSSVHFQAVDRLGEGLRIEARAPDGLIEAFSAEVRGAPVLAVQWHPEWDADQRPQSQTFFRMLGRALRGQPLAPP